MSVILLKKSHKGLKISLKLRLIASLLLIICGAGMIFWVSLKSFDASNQKPNEVSSVHAPEQVMAKPAKIHIPKLARTLDVSDGEVVNNRWVISASGASYLTSSALPGKLGNTVIYGHNKRDILGGLVQVAEGDSIYVTMDNGQVFRYTVFEKREVKPTQVEILKQSQDARLTIYTCNGFLDQARFVVVSRLESTTI